MTDRHVDVAIIGTGSAGMSAYRAARNHTQSLALIEGGEYGTTCARVGCMPSKLLIAAAEVNHTIHGAKTFGIDAPAPHVDGARVMERVRRERDRFVGGVLNAVEGFAPEHRIRGYARFLDDHRLQVDDGTTLYAERIVIATGSRPVAPRPWVEALGERLVYNDDVFDWERLPDSVAVFGGGVIGLELAQALHRLGVRMRLFGKDGFVGPLTDPTVKAHAAELFRQEYPFYPDGKVGDIRRQGDQVAISFTDDDGTEREELFDYLLAATGRRASVDNLGLEHTSLPLDAQGVPIVDPLTSQVGHSHVFIAGDATNTVPLLHEAADEGRIAGDNAGRYPDIRVRPRRAPLSVVFCDPQIALVGATHAELAARDVPMALGDVDFAGQGRARVIDRNRGLLRVYGEHGSGRFLGAEMCAPAAEHMGHLLAWALQQQMTVQEMIDSPFYHPVIEEGVRTALRKLQQALRMGPMPPENCIDCGPGG